MARVVIILLPCIVAAILLVQDAKCSKDEEAIIGDLFIRQRYNKAVRPAESPSDVVLVHYGISVINILDVETNRKSADVTMQTWPKHLWQDYRLTWDPADFGGISVLRVPSSYVWKPDIVLVSSLEDSHLFDPMFNVLIYSTGDVLWIPTKNEKIRCARNGEVLDCKMTYMSWSYDGTAIGLDWYEGQTKLELSDFNYLSDYTITKNNGTYEDKEYPCCEETYPTITFEFTLTL